MSVRDIVQAAAGAGKKADPNFNQTVLLLHGDGTNGAQNNTFLDSSSNNFSITRNGNTTQGTFSPFSVADGEWSNYFDGSGAYLTAANNSAFEISTGDWTIEAWIHPSNFSVVRTITTYEKATVSTFADASWGFSVNTNSKARFVISNGNTAAALELFSTSNIAANQYTHLAVCKSGTTYTLFVNGVSEDTDTLAGTPYVATSSVLHIGGRNSLAQRMLGYISNLRIVKGTAVYTGAFTPPTAPLTAITNTSLLTCQSNRFVDNSSNAFALTVVSTPSVQPFSPFAPSAAYDPSVNGGSGYFDGTGDSLSITDVSSLLDFGTGAFTVSLWFYKVNTANDVAIVDARQTGSNAGWFLAIDSSGELQFTNVGGSVNISGSTAIIRNRWYYVHISRSGTTVSMYLNGALEASGSESGNVNCDGIVFGAKRYTSSGFGDFFGYLSGINIVTGTATSNAVPSAPTTGGTFLANFTNAGIFDNTGKNNLETVGNAQISTSVKKYGTGSMEFDGTGDYLVSSGANQNLNVGSGNFTIEGWFYFNSTPSTMGLFQMSATAGGFVGNQSANLAVATASSTTWQIYAKNTFTISSTTSVPVTTWTHFALVRNGTDTNLYINGTSVISLASDTTVYNTPYLGVGGIFDNSSYLLNGYIDDLRITKGIARYTANFTPPTAPFEDQ
jgi:hypothetical protein